MYSICQFSALYSHFQVTSGQMMSLPGHSGHFRSRDVISCHVTSTSCELEQCRTSNVPKTRLRGLLQHFLVTSGEMTPNSGDFRSHEIT